MAGQPLATRFDVLGLGIVTVDDFLYVESYPPADSKVRVLKRLRQCGGLTGTALVAAARLGAKCSYAGVLGPDELSDFIRASLHAERIDLESLHPRVKSPPIHSTIVVDEAKQTRTIFFERKDLLDDDSEWPPATLIESAGVLFVDHKHSETMIRAARIARAAGRPVVADLERDEAPLFDGLLAVCDHLILSRDFAAKITGLDDPRNAAEALWRPDRSAVVVTCGADGSWTRSADSVHHQRAFSVPVVDTTGCGDVFHGAYAAALAWGEPLDRRLRLASAAAAIKAMSHGGQAGIPTRERVDRFLQEHAG